MDANMRMLLDMAKTFLGHANRTNDDLSRVSFGAAANAYYNSAWVVAGCPAFSDEWPGYDVWSARETMRRAA